MDSGKKKMRAIWAHDSWGDKGNIDGMKEDRTRDRDLEIMCEIAWATGTEAMEEGECRKRALGLLAANWERDRQGEN